MSANQRRALISMGRPFAPLFAEPSGSIDTIARKMLVYIYTLSVVTQGAGVASVTISELFPLTLTITQEHPLTLEII